MRYYLDTEFIEYGKTIDLISIGIVAEDGREFYAISKEFDWNKAIHCDWLYVNVLRQLPPVTRHCESIPVGVKGINVTTENLPEYKSRDEIKQGILEFIGDDPHPEFWADYAAYDWVALCQLFGKMIDLPTGWPFYCRDIRQALDEHFEGREYEMPAQLESRHHALHDARHVKQLYDFWRSLQTTEPSI